MLVNELDIPTFEPSKYVDRIQLRQELLRLSADHWVVRTPVGYMLTRYSDVVSLLRDQRWHSAVRLLNMQAGFPATNRAESVLSAEGETHARLRRLVAPAFSPRAADRLRPFMREVINSLVSQAEANATVNPGGKRTFDFVSEICEPYPIPIICELLGAPKSDWRDFSRWATDLLKIFNGNWAQDGDAIIKARDEIDLYVRDLIAQRRSTPTDDLLSDLIAAEESGDRLNTEELEVMVEAIILGGTDTTRNQLGCSISLFTTHIDQWHQLADDPTLATAAVDETMRYLGAIRGAARFATEDIDIKGVRFPKMTVVMTSHMAANFDPDVFADPGTFDITRKPASQHLTFGSGIHYCLGASLAKAELQEALPILAQRWPQMALAEPVRWKSNTSGIWGAESLVLTI